MDESKEIVEELQSISPIFSQIKKMPLGAVPDRYFDTLPDRILAWVLAHENTISSEHVPNQYFENLSDQIIAAIHENEETQKEKDNFKVEFPILHSLKDKQVLKVPAGYFEKLTSSVVEKQKINKSAPIISLTTKWWKYAAAAVLGGFMLVGALQFYNPSSLKTNSDVIASSQYKTEEDINKGIASLTDDDIIAYLENHGNITDNNLLTTDVNVKELPSVEDYLINENALNDYLKRLENSQFQ